jgi:flagellar motor switch protein FliM
MAVDRAQDREPVSLVRAADPAVGFPGLNVIGDRLIRGIRSEVEGLGLAGCKVTAAPVTLTSFAEWRELQPKAAGLVRLSLAPLKGAALALLPLPLIACLVDGFYGGTGEQGSDRQHFSGAETRFLARFADALSAVFKASWTDVHPVSGAILSVVTDWPDLSFVQDKDIVAIQTLGIAGSSLDACSIAIVYPVASLRAAKALSAATGADAALTIDASWTDRMAEAVLEARVPIRTIFARTELPLTRLLSLEPGDLIPICLPTRVPITVSGRLFAEATVGESNGRASIRIEKIEQGLRTND